MNTKKKVVESMNLALVKAIMGSFRNRKDENGNPRKLDIKFGRTPSVSAFVQYLENIDGLPSNITEFASAMERYLTRDEKFEYEKKAEEKEKEAAAEAEAVAKMLADFGL